ncbi:MAG: DUF4037 domain-containing protein [Calditrichaeota bacterium]|nr:DUF4037 domain-containing protein [Calditrichota bacterium]
MTIENPKPTFIPGLELSKSFFQRIVEPILTLSFPGLKYSAALIGTGSEVLGFDTEMSTDHHWGPRFMLFLHPDDFGQTRKSISNLLRKKIPPIFTGYSTNFTQPDLEDNGVQKLTSGKIGSVNHRVETYTISGFFNEYLDIDIEKPVCAADWLTLSHQKLRSICTGGVFRDDLGLNVIRDRFKWYPRDVWIYILASCWSRIGEDEHLMGRAGIVGDEIGSSLIASRIVQVLMRLAFLMERVYPPYAKWFGTAFSQLGCAGKLKPILLDILSAPSWKDRDTGLANAYKYVAGMHNQLEITPVIPCEPTLFFGRPFHVIHSERFACELRKIISDKKVKRISRKRLIGNIDLVSDNTDLIEDNSRRRTLLALYD